MCLPNANLLGKNMEKSKFRQIYDALPAKAPVAPKTAFVKEVAELCKVSEKTVRCWLAGAQKPDALKRSLLSQKLGVPENELFN